MLFLGRSCRPAVGADVPTSLALVGEFAPSKARGKLLGFTQVAWCLGPVIVLWMAMALAPLGLLGIRIVFLQLFVVSLVTWALRRGLAESARWTAAKSVKEARHQVGALFAGANLKALVWTATIYLFWNLAAGTYGIFFPYFIRTLHAGGQAVSVGLSSATFVLTMIVTVTVFMKFSDRDYRTRRLLWGSVRSWRSPRSSSSSCSRSPSRDHRNIVLWGSAPPLRRGVLQSLQPGALSHHAARDRAGYHVRCRPDHSRHLEFLCAGARPRRIGQVAGLRPSSSPSAAWSGSSHARYLRQIAGANRA